MERGLTLAIIVFVSLRSVASCVVADYPFTGDANDVTGNGYHATVIGATLTEDRFGNPNSAYEFNGFSDHIRTYSTFDFQLRTVSLWVMFYDNNEHRTVVTQDANSLDYGAVSLSGVNGDIRGRAGGTGSAGAEHIETNYDVNKWYHVVLVRNADSTFYYSNGELVFAHLANGGGSVSGGNEEFLIGVSRTLSNRYHYGKIDDLKIYSCALSSDQVTELYQEGVVTPDCKVADYPFNGNALDATGNGYDGSAFGPQLSYDRFGGSDSAYEFDGENDLIRTYSTFDFESRSVSMWFKPYGANEHQTVLTQDAHTLEHGAFHLSLEGGQIKARAGGTGTVVMSSGYTVGQWYHAVLIRDIDSLRYYLNGELVAVGTSNSDGSIDGSNEEFLIGVSRTMSSRFFHGMIDDVAIYDCALTNDEVDALYGDFDGVGQTSPPSISGFSLYPNPASTMVRLDMDGSDPIVTIDLLDVNGRKVRSMIPQKGGDFLMDLRGMPTGVYLVFVETADGRRLQERLVLQQ